MFALNRLKEQSLRRLYKFILKRVIGQYLDRELVLEQLTVESRTGKVSLKNLHFNVTLLNELLQGVPFRIVCAEVADLEATISYNTLLADGCNLTARGCKIVFAPIESQQTSNGHSRHPASSKRTETHSTAVNESESYSGKDDPGREEDPLLFIAQWIEVVIARLQCTVEDLEIIFASHSQLANHLSNKMESSSNKRRKSMPEAASVHFTFDTLSFFNTHPKMLQSDFSSSTIASTSHILGSYDETGELDNAEADISLLSFRKLLSVRSIRVEVRTHTQEFDGVQFESTASTPTILPLLHFTEGGTIEMMIQPPGAKRRPRRHNDVLQQSNSQSLAYNDAALDMEIRFPKLVCNLQATQAPILLAVANAFSEGKCSSTEASLLKPAAPSDEYSETQVGNLGMDMIKLQEGLRCLHQKKTIETLEELGELFSNNDDERSAEPLFPIREKGDEVDFGRLAHLLKKYQLTRELLSAEDRARRAASLSSETATLKNSIVEQDVTFLSSPVESDSEVEFPTGRVDLEGDSSVSSKAIFDLEDYENDDDESGLFFDTKEDEVSTTVNNFSNSRSKVRFVRKGDKSLDDSALNESIYGTQSMADSMFHTATNISVNLGSSSKRLSDDRPKRTENVDPAIGSLPGGSFFRLYVDDTEVVYQDDRLFSQSCDSSENEEEAHRLKRCRQVQGEKLVLQLDKTVMTFSAPATDTTPVVISKVAPKLFVSVGGIVLYERLWSTKSGDMKTDNEMASTPHSRVLLRLSSDTTPDMSSLVIPPEPMPAVKLAGQKCEKGKLNVKCTESSDSFSISDGNATSSFGSPVLELYGTLFPLDCERESGGTTIQINFQHATSSLCVATILKWVKRVEGVVEVQQEPTSGRFRWECSISVKSLEVQLLCDPEEKSTPVDVDSSPPSSQWRDDSPSPPSPNKKGGADLVKPRLHTDWTKVSLGLGLGSVCTTNSRWKKVRSDSVYRLPDQTVSTATPPGCVRIVLADINVTFLSCNLPGTASNFSLKLSTINAFLRLYSPYMPTKTSSPSPGITSVAKLLGYFHVYELGFLSMRSHGHDRISLTKSEFDTADFEAYAQKGNLNTFSSKNTDKGTGEASNNSDGAFVVTSQGDDRNDVDSRCQMKQPNEIIEIDTQIVRADLRSLELNALVSIIKGIVPSTPCAEASLSRVHDGEQSHRNNAEIYQDNVRVMMPKSSTFFAVRVSAHILSFCLAPDTVFLKENKKLDDVLSYSFSIREPHFEFVSSTSFPKHNFNGVSSPSIGNSYIVKDLYTIKASDLSFFEMPLHQLETTATCTADDNKVTNAHSAGRGESCRGARFRDSAKTIDQDFFHIPLLHRTSLESAMMGEVVDSFKDDTKVQSFSEKGTGHCRPKHRALRFTVCMLEEVALTVNAPVNRSSAVVNSSSLRNTSFDLCLSDMTYRFDPASIWFQRFPEIFDSIGCTDILPGGENVCEVTSSTSKSESPVPSISVFGRTRLSFTVKKLLVDCCLPDRKEELLRNKLAHTHKLHPERCVNEKHDGERPGREDTNKRFRSDSRLLLNIGEVTATSTLVTNSDRVALSVKLSDANVRASNKLLRNPRPRFRVRNSGEYGPVGCCVEQSPVDILGYYIEEVYQHSSSQFLTEDPVIDFDSFLDVHGFVSMGTLDHCDIKIHLNTPSPNLAAARQRLARERATLVDIDKLDSTAVSDNSNSEFNTIPIAVDCSCGSIVAYGCADSLLVLMESIDDIVDSVNANKKCLHQDSNEGGDFSKIAMSEPSQMSRTLPVPSQTALMLSPVSAIRHSFVTSERNDKRLVTHNDLPSSRKDEINDVVSEHDVDRTYDVTDHIVDESKNMTNTRDGKAFQKLRPVTEDTYPRKGNDWGNDLDDLFLLDEDDTKSSSFTDSYEGNKFGRGLDEMGEKDMGTSGGGLIKDSTWLNSLQDDMFAPSIGDEANSVVKQLQSTPTTGDLGRPELPSTKDTYHSQDNSKIFGGLGAAVIEEFYPEPLKEEFVDDEPEFEAKFYAQYDYDDVDSVACSNIKSFDYEEVEDNFDGIEEVDDGIDLKSNGHESVTSSHSSSSGYSQESFENDSNSDEMGAMWQSWGAMRSVPEMQHQKNEEEMHEMVSLSSNVLNAPLGSVADGGDKHGNSILDINIDTDGESSDVSSNGDKNEVLPFVQVHTEGVIDDDHQRAWGNMSFYPTDKKSASQSKSQVKMEVVGLDEQSVKLDDISAAADDQKAVWYDMSSIQNHQIHPLHMTEPPRDKNSADEYTRDNHGGTECLITPRLNVSVKFSVKVKLFSGQEWPDNDLTDLRSRMSDSDCETSQSLSTVESMPPKEKPRRGKYDNSARIERHLGDLAKEGTGKGRNLFHEADSISRTKQQSQARKKMSAGYKQRSDRVIASNTPVSRDKSNGHTEISFSACRVIYRIYPHHSDPKMSSAAFTSPTPSERYLVRVHDMLVSYTPTGSKPKKVLGNWLNPSKPVESHLPLLSIDCVGFDLDNSSNAPRDNSSYPDDTTDGMEYRMEASVLPLRCYLDGAYVDFIRNFVGLITQQQQARLDQDALLYSKLKKEFGLSVSTKSIQEYDTLDNETVERGPSVLSCDIGPTVSSKVKGAMNAPVNAKESAKRQTEKSVGRDEVPRLSTLKYFQAWKVNPIELKINYSPNPLNFRALQNGDYLQLLNLLSIEALELSLSKVWLVGVSGAAAGFNKMGEEWVKEIYAHQMHRLLSSTGPLRGISSIGSSLHGLLLIPVQEYRTNGAVGVLKAMKRESLSLIKTVTRETLTASSKLSHFLATTLVELVSDSGGGQHGGGHRHRSEKQPTGFTDSLDKAYEAVSREVTSALDTIVVLPFREYRRSGQPGGALRCVIRAIPVAVLRPTAGAAEALSYTLLGLRNNVDPEQRIDEEDMWNVTMKEE